MKNQIVLMYHDLFFSEKSESGFQNSTALKYKVSAKAFEAQVQSIVNYLKCNNLPKESVDFTFDDGGISSILIAAPLLEKYGLKGKFYISTAYLGTKGFLNGEQVRQLFQRGHYVGSHSHTHPERMSILAEKEIDDEWSVSQAILKEIIGHSPHLASVPNGYVSERVLDGMLKSGIEMIDTSAIMTKEKHYKTSTLRGRYAITEDTTINQIMKIISSPSYRFVKRLRYMLLEIAKMILGSSYLTLRRKIFEICKI